MISGFDIRISAQHWNIHIQHTTKYANGDNESIGINFFSNVNSTKFANFWKNSPNFQYHKIGEKQKACPDRHYWMNVCVQHTIFDEALEVHIPTHIHSMFSGALCFFQIQNAMNCNEQEQACASVVIILRIHPR
jgi:hypothetical protein